MFIVGPGRAQDSPWRGPCHAMSILIRRQARPCLLRRASSQTKSMPGVPDLTLLALTWHLLRGGVAPGAPFFVCPRPRALDYAFLVAPARSCLPRKCSRKCWKGDATGSLHAMPCAPWRRSTRTCSHCAAKTMTAKRSSRNGGQRRLGRRPTCCPTVPFAP